MRGLLHKMGFDKTEVPMTVLIYIDKIFKKKPIVS